MNKPNIFKSSRFFMDAGDTLHILVKDLVGSAISLSLNNGDDDSEEDTVVIGTTTETPTTTALPPLLDKDGNEYTSVIIGSQEWIVENLRTTTYGDGTPIPNLTDDGDWIADVTGAYCYYDNDEATYKGDYGTLYNWYAVSNANGLAYLEKDGIEEVGWRIPTETDFNTLSTFLGGDLVSGGKLKEAGLAHWDAPNTGGDNSSGFTALPSGYRSYLDGTFSNIGRGVDFWSSSDDMGDPIAMSMDTDNSNVVISDKDFNGFSVRLVRDI